MFLAQYRFTESGARQRAAERGLSFPAPKTPRIAPSAPTAVPVASNVVRLDSRLHRVAEARFDAIAAVWLNCRLENAKPTAVSMGRLFGRDHNSIRSALRQRGVDSTRTKFPKKQPLRPWRMKCK